MKPRAKAGCSSVLSDLAEKARALLTEIGIPEEIARGFGAELADQFRRHWAGSKIYIPKTRASERDRMLASKFTGNNHRELADDFGLSVRRVYGILKRPGKSGQVPKRAQKHIIGESPLGALTGLGGPHPRR